MGNNMHFFIFLKLLRPTTIINLKTNQTMKKANLLLKVLSFSALVTFTAACKKQDVVIEKELSQNEIPAEFQKIIPIIEAEEGGKIDRSQLFYDASIQSIVYGDMAYPKGYQSFLNRHDGDAQIENNFHTRGVVAANFAKNIKVFIDASIPSRVTANNISARNVIDWALYYWSNSTQFGSIRFILQNTASGADIVVSAGTLSGVAFGQAQLPVPIPGFPGLATPGKTIKFDFSSNKVGSSGLSEKTFFVLALHEIGHTLGFRHADQNVGILIPGTNDFNFHAANACGSIMRSAVDPCSWSNSNIRAGLPGSWTGDDFTMIRAYYP
jgi:hypothetical protein